MTNWLADYTLFKNEEANKVSKIYDKYFPKSFRSNTNDTIIKLDRWSTMGPNNRIVAFCSIMKIYLKRCPNNEEFVKLALANQSTYSQYLDECFNEELCLKIRPRKSTRTGASGSVSVTSVSANVHQSTRSSVSGSNNNRSQNPLAPVPEAASVSTGRAYATRVRATRARLENIASQLNKAMISGHDELGQLQKVKAALDGELSLIRSAICCWQRKQQWYANEFEDGEVKYVTGSEATDVDSFYATLNAIGEDAQFVCDLLYTMIDRTGNLKQQNKGLEELQKSLLLSLNRLQRMCFLVIRQPDQVLKADNKFNLTVSLLAGWRKNQTRQAWPISCDVLLENALEKMHHLFDVDAIDSNVSLTESDTQHKIKIISPEVRLECIGQSSEEPTTKYKAGAVKRHASTDRKNETECSFAARQLPHAYHADFEGLKWKKADSERRSVSNSSVTDLKYALVFEVNWPVILDQFGVNVNYVKLRCMSLPITCVVHVNQDVRASGTIFWDNAFAPYKSHDTCKCVRSAGDYDRSERNYSSNYASVSQTPSTSGVSTDTLAVSGMSQVTVAMECVRSKSQQNGSIDSGSLFGDGNDNGGIHYCRLPFQVPDKVGWPVFKRELKRWFQASTTYELTDRHMEFIKECVIPITPVYTSVDGKPSPNPTVSRCRVLTDTIDSPIQGTSFWSWLFCLKKLIVDKTDPLLSFLWKSGYIHFATHQQAKDLLESVFNQDQLARASLIRFCTSECVKSTNNNNANLAAAKRGAIVLTQGYLAFNEIQTVKIDVRSIEPWNSEHLKNMCLKKRLESEQLKRQYFLCPDGQIKDWDSLILDFDAELHRNERQKNSATADRQPPSQYVETDIQLVVKDARDASSRGGSTIMSPRSSATPGMSPGTPNTENGSLMCPSPPTNNWMVSNVFVGPGGADNFSTPLVSHETSVGGFNGSSVTHDDAEDFVNETIMSSIVGASDVSATALAPSVTSLDIAVDSRPNFGGIMDEIISLIDDYTMNIAITP